MSDGKKVTTITITEDSDTANIEFKMADSPKGERLIAKAVANTVNGFVNHGVASGAAGLKPVGVVFYAKSGEQYAVNAHPDRHDYAEDGSEERQTLAMSLQNDGLIGRAVYTYRKVPNVTDPIAQLAAILNGVGDH